MKKGRGVGCESCRRKASGFLSDNIVVDEMLGKGLKPLEAYKGYKSPWLCKCLVCKKIKKLAVSQLEEDQNSFRGAFNALRNLKMKNELKIQKELC